jgi:2-haloacid dehalogenase
MSKYQLVIFDLDDTLFDYEETERAAVIKTCENWGIADDGSMYSKYRRANDTARIKYPDITPRNIRQFRCARAIEFLELIGRVEITADRFVERYLEYSTVGVLICGVQETLEAMEGVTKVVATNGSNFPRRNKLENSTIANYFHGYYSAEDLGVSKSNPDYFLTIIARYDVPKERILIVGDDYRLDITAAIGIGVDCCWFNYRKEKMDITVPDTVRVIERFEDLIDIISDEPYEEKHKL